MVDLVLAGRAPAAKTRDRRLQGKVSTGSARCRGGDKAPNGTALPWLNWPNYYGTGDQTLKGPSDVTNRHDIGSALIDLERERVELIGFNLFDNSGSFREYIVERQNTEGPAIKVFTSMRLSSEHASYTAEGGAGDSQDGHRDYK